MEAYPFKRFLEVGMPYKIGQDITRQDKTRQTDSEIDRQTDSEIDRRTDKGATKHSTQLTAHTRLDGGIQPPKKFSRQVIHEEQL